MIHGQQNTKFTFIFTGYLDGLVPLLSCGSMAVFRRGREYEMDLNEYDFVALRQHTGNSNTFGLRLLPLRYDQIHSDAYSALADFLSG
jgi:hypothetical protein